FVLLFYLMLLPPPRSTLFPYTTLFRSGTMAQTNIIGPQSIDKSLGHVTNKDNALTNNYTTFANISSSTVLGLITTHGYLDFNHTDRKSTRLNSSHVKISYAVFCLKKKK